MGTNRDVEARRGARIALSELYLDTELREAELERLGAELARTPFEPEELDRILWEEVHPILWTNTLATAGVWTGFDPDWLEEQIERRQRQRLRWPNALTARGSIREVWKELRAAVVDKRRDAR